MKKTARFLAAVLAAVLIAGIVRPAAAQTPNLQGVYTLDPSTAGGVQQAIKNVTSQMGFFKQGIAQKRLTASNQPPPTLTITQTATDITIQGAAGPAIRTSMNGTPVAVTGQDGTQAQVSSIWQGSTLQRTFTAQDGVRTNTYSLDPSGKTLTVGVQLTSPELPQPLTYQLLYRRAN